MQHYVSYLRVSTSRQGESGLGLEAQREAVRGYISGSGGALDSEYVEVESGKLRDRPVLTAALAHCRKQKAILVIAKLDRLARNVAFVSSLMEARTEFVAVDAPFANRLMVHIMAAFAEHEREQIAQRTRAALAAAKARGVKLGVNGARLAARRKAEAAEFAEGLRQVVTPMAHDVPLRVTADQLNAAGFRTREGAAWCPVTVRRLLIRLGLRPSVSCATAASGGSPGRCVAPSATYPPAAPRGRHDASCARSWKTC